MILGAPKFRAVDVLVFFGAVGLAVGLGVLLRYLSEAGR